MSRVRGIAWVFAAAGLVLAAAPAASQTSADETVVPPRGFALADNRRYGASRIHILRRSGA